MHSFIIFEESPADKPSLKRKEIQTQASLTPARRVKAKTDKPLLPEVPPNLPKPMLIPVQAAPPPVPATSPFTEKVK